MVAQINLSIRSATNQDRQQLANVIHFEARVHRHLDWRAPLDWIGHEPFLIAGIDGNIVAALACPPDPVEVAWIRLFAVASPSSPSDAWQALWPAAHDMLASQPGISIAVQEPPRDPPEPVPPSTAPRRDKTNPIATLIKHDATTKNTLIFIVAGLYKVGHLLGTP